MELLPGFGDGGNRVEVALAPEIEQVVRDKVASGEYPSVASLVEEALFLLVERDWIVSQQELRKRAPFLLNQPEVDAQEGNPS